MGNSRARSITLAWLLHSSSPLAVHDLIHTFAFRSTKENDHMHSQFINNLSKWHHSHCLEFQHNVWSGNYSKYLKVLVSHVQLFVIPWVVAHQAPLSMEFSRQDKWNWLPFPSQGIFRTQWLNPGLPYCRNILYHLSHLLLIPNWNYLYKV